MNVPILLRTLRRRPVQGVPAIHRSALVAALGFVALAAQTLLLRAYLTAFESHELAIACFFGSWFLWVAAGAALGRRVSGRLPDRILGRVFGLLALLYLPAYASELWLITSARALIDLPSFAVFPFGHLVVLSLAANAAVSLVTGFLFTLACRWWTVAAAPAPGAPCAPTRGRPVAHVFVLETLGAAAGGVTVTLLLAAGVLPARVLLTAVALLGLAVSLAWPVRPWLRALPLLLGLGLMVSPLAELWTEHDARRRWSCLLPDAAYRGRFATARADYLYGEHEGRFEVMSAGTVCESLPRREHGARVAALALSQHPDARRVLVIGPGSLGVARALAELPDLESVTWLHPDPGFPGALVRVLPEALRRGLERIRIPDAAIDDVIAQPGPRPDLAILHLPDAGTLAENRCFTRTFLASLEHGLAPDAVVAIRVTGGANVLAPESARLGASVLATLRSLWPHQALQPGEESWLFASNHDRLAESPARLRDRWAAIPGAAALFPPDALLSLYPPDRIAFQKQAYGEAAEQAGGERTLVHTGDRPLALLFTLLLTLRQGGVTGLPEGLALLFRGGAWFVAAAIVLHVLLRLVYRIRTRPGGAAPSADSCEPRTLDSAWLVLSTGLAGMALSIVLMFAFQARHGTLFLHVGLASALFMLGAFGGSLAMESGLARTEREPRALLPLVLCAHLVFLAATGAMLPALGSRPGFAALFALAGVFTGVYFPLVAKRLGRSGWTDAGAGAALEALDHLGAAIGAMLTGLFLLPVLGVSTALALLGGAVAANLVLALAPGRAAPRAAAGGAAGDRGLRPLGYVLFGVGAWLLFSSNLVAHLRGQQSARRLEDAARVLLHSDELEPKTARLPDGRALPYVRGPVPEGGLPGESGARQEGAAPAAYVFSTAMLAPDVHGYQGPITLALSLDHRGKLLDYAILQCRETPAYLERTRSLRDRMVGHSVLEDRTWSGIDAVSGATRTSRALVETIRSAGRMFAVQVLGLDAASAGGDGSRGESGGTPVDTDLLWLAGFLLAAMLLRFRPGRWVRRTFLLLSLVILGLGLNLQYSTQHVFSLLDPGWPPAAATATFLLVIGLPLLTLLVGNVYCGYVCPFGALQELVGEARPKRWPTDPTRAVWRYGRFAKYLLLFWLVALFSLTRDFTVLSPDPLLTVFGAGRSASTLFWAAAVVVLAFPFRRFWCRNLCPAGAFLALLGRVRLLRAASPEPRVGACDLGVQNRRELDCLCCDRCRHG